ncbi:MAG: hypothetical protein CL925_15735 [Deltaproteobacteria bacterium]|nr:hypothetical protein [Deltaproteobacteria bacterium]
MSGWNRNPFESKLILKAITFMICMSPSETTESSFTLIRYLGKPPKFYLEKINPRWQYKLLKHLKTLWPFYKGRIKL